RHPGEDLWLEATRMAERLRGPLALIATLAQSDVSAAQTRAAGASSDASLAPGAHLILGAAEDALKDIDAIGSRVDHAVALSKNAPVGLEEIVCGALGRMGRAAGFAVHYPRQALRTNLLVAENILQRCFELAALENAGIVRLGVAPLALDARRLRLKVSFNTGLTVADRRGRLPALRGLENLVASFGGQLEIAWHPDAGETTLDLTMPGRLETQDPAAVSRTRPEGLTAPTPFGRAFSEPGRSDAAPQGGLSALSRRAPDVADAAIPGVSRPGVSTPDAPGRDDFKRSA
ncbi:MAG: hypothetical protein AAGB05_05375, partial [Pseudomonadota bacterium]